MANILQGLGQSQAISGYLQGVNDLRQKALQEKTGEQALQMNDQSMAINKFKFDQMKADKAAGERMASMDPIFNQQRPEVQKVMQGLLSPYLETVQGVPNMVRAKNQKEMLDLLHHPEAAQLIGNAQKKDMMNDMQELDKQIKQMTTPDAKTGKVPVSDSKGAEAYQELINKRADVQKKFDVQVGHLDALSKGITGYQEEELKQKQNQQKIELEKDFTPDSVDAYLNGTGQLVQKPKQMDEFQTFKTGYLSKNPTATGDEVVKAFKSSATTGGLGDLQTFEAETGTSSDLRGTKEYQNKIMSWRNKKAVETKININMPTTQDTATIATSMAKGKYPPEMVGTRNGRNAIHSEVLRQYPNYNFSQSEANYKYMVNPTNLKTISYAKALLEPNPDTGLSRIDLLRQKADALTNINPLFANKTLNYIANQGGSKQVVDFESLRNDLILEAAAAFTGGVPTDVRTKIAMENLKSSNSPAQLKASLDNLTVALQSRQDAAQSVPYPWEVVRGERTMGNIMKEIKSNTKGNTQGVHQELPPANQYKGKYATNPDTGEQFQSNGQNWVKVK